MIKFDNLFENINLVNSEELSPYTTFDEIHYPFENKLVLFYCSNDFIDINILINILKLNCTLILQNNTTDISSKVSIESQFSPDFIIDGNRKVIKKYKAELTNKGFNYFKIDSLLEKNTLIDKNIKLLLSTSGSTGVAKYVKLSKENIVSNAISITKYLPVVKNDNLPLMLPVSYSYGFSLLTTHLLVGASIYCSCPEIMSKNFFEYIDKHNYNSLHGVPFTYEFFYKMRIENFNLSSIKYITQAGGKLNENLTRYFLDLSVKKGFNFFKMYGQTEATARIAFIPPDKLASKINSIGIPIPDGELDIENGELIYYGKNVYLGYAKNRDELFNSNKSYKLYTGDKGYKDEDGYFYLTGRKKNFMKLNGERIDLDGINLFLENEFDKVIFLIVNSNDKKLVVFYKSDQDLNSEIKSSLKTKNIRPQQLKIFNVPEFLININGKTDKNQMIKNYL
tara:strand:+ start:5685 stop:7040 length:1356 start_codon:yes stop_codon:yes gene_type:complete